MSNRNRYRYKGVQSFTEADTDIFFGRIDDINNLYNLILLEQLLVLFGKSGYGKSSLLNAGVIPKLKAQNEQIRYVPIRIRFGISAEPNTMPSPVQKTILELENALGVSFLENHFLKELVETEDLWYHFKRYQDGTIQQQFVLIFDQFEEFFQYSEAAQKEFKQQLARLLYVSIPQNIRSQMSHLEDSQLDRLIEPLRVKVVFAIRSDKLSDLDGLKDALPAILHKRYKLRPLSPAQAREAIEKPAALDYPFFKTPCFEYREKTLYHIVEELLESTKTGIESFQLQLVCKAIEEQIELNKIKDRDGNGLPDVEVEDVPKFKEIYEHYCESKLSAFSNGERKIVNTILENNLIVDKRRVHVDIRTLINKYPTLKQGLLDQLVDTFLIRKEPNSVESHSIEIAHDKLIEPILVLKEKRDAPKRKSLRFIAFSLGILMTLTVVGYLIKREKEAISTKFDRFMLDSLHGLIIIPPSTENKVSLDTKNETFIDKEFEKAFTFKNKLIEENKKLIAEKDSISNKYAFLETELKNCQKILEKSKPSVEGSFSNELSDEFSKLPLKRVDTLKQQDGSDSLIARFTYNERLVTLRDVYVVMKQRDLYQRTEQLQRIMEVNNTQIRNYKKYIYTLRTQIDSLSKLHK